jgi:predicted metal-dependent hydrolase
MNDFDPRYRAYFTCFNRQEFFEAHEVLEELWLITRDRRRDFYKGLIQTAAAFLKWQQAKPGPAERLARRAAALLQPYAPMCEGLRVQAALDLLDQLPHRVTQPPRLELEPPCD